MVAVLIASDKNDVFGKQLWQILKKSFSVLSLCDKVLQLPEGTPQLLLAEPFSGHKLVAEHALMVYQSMCDFQITCAKENTISIVDACNPELLSFVSKTGTPAVTCGMSPRDTVTLSSIGEESCVVNLQRSVRSFAGELIEPQEIPIRFSGKLSGYLLMAVALIFLLTGNKAQLEDVTISG